jgi:phytoene dehydrogenase-like protein
MSDSNPNARRANTPAPAEVDVAIVGAGLGGLVAGATLARAGRSVAVFDAHYVAGGCATHFTRGPRSKRYHFDVGVHYVGDCGAEGQIPRMLRGLDAPVEFEPLDPDGFDTLVFPDLTFRIPADVGLYRERLLGLFPDQRRGIDGYLRVLQAVMRAGRTMDANDGRIDWRAALSMARDALPLALHAEHTIAQLFDRVGVRDPRLRAVLARTERRLRAAPEPGERHAAPRPRGALFPRRVLPPRRRPTHRRRHRRQPRTCGRHPPPPAPRRPRARRIRARRRY